MSETDMNLELRKEIIEIALTIEDAINKLLTTYLHVYNENLRAFGNKNSGLSFKNKIDILVDIGVLNKPEHFKFLTLMEFRNQFMHNIDCNSFEKAIEILGADREKHLLNFNSLKEPVERELKLKHCFMALHLNCIDIILRKYEENYERVKVRRKSITDVAEFGNFIIDKDTELLSIIAKQCEPSLQDSKELPEFKSRVFSTMVQFTNAIKQNDSFKLVTKQIKELFDTEQKIWNFFK